MLAGRMIAAAAAAHLSPVWVLDPLCRGWAAALVQAGVRAGRRHTVAELAVSALRIQHLLDVPTEECGAIEIEELGLGGHGSIAGPPVHAPYTHTHTQSVMRSLTTAADEQIQHTTEHERRRGRRS